MKQIRSIRAATLCAAIILAGLAPATRAKAVQDDFSFRSLDGGEVSSASLNGKVVVLAVAASWLPLTQKQAQGVAKLAADYAGRGVVVYWVFTDSEKAGSRNFATDAQLKSFAARNGINLRVLRDPDGTAVKRFGISQVPAFVIMDRTGHIQRPAIEGIDPEGDLNDTIGQRLQGLL
jgi:peroxiredoxin